MNQISVEDLARSLSALLNYDIEILNYSSDMLWATVPESVRKNERYLAQFEEEVLEQHDWEWLSGTTAIHLDLRGK